MFKSFITLAFLFAVLAPANGHTEDDPCSSAGAHVLVDTGSHTLWLCEGTKVIKSFGVRLASGGVDKTREGDKKVPLGRYTLATPRPSKRYGTFILVGYPTREQKRRGFTGGSIGIHGPDRRLEPLGWVNNLFDTTDGCIGVASDEEMEEISRWLRASKASRVEIR